MPGVGRGSGSGSGSGNGSGGSSDVAAAAADATSAFYWDSLAPALKLIEQALVGLHDVTGLPWCVW